MPKKRYALYLSRPLANRLEVIARQRHGSKSALLEEALRNSLEPEQVPGIEEGLARRLDELQRIVATVARDMTVASETLGLFVRYFLIVTPPIPEDEQEPARLTGRQRYDIFAAEVGKRVAENRRLAIDVLQTVSRNQPDLFSTPPNDGPLNRSVAPTGVDASGAGTPTGRERNGHA